MMIIGIVGTAKNTGKTTTLSAILRFCLSSGLLPGLTSIGYDGEDLDNITYLPKPKLNIAKNSVIATSELCLKNTKAKFKVLAKTDIITPLGRVLIAEITNAGEIVLAGPNNIRDLGIILDLLKDYKPGIIFVDGALNRMAPMFLADKLIFSTGASRNTDVNFLVSEMSLISKIFHIPLEKDNVFLSKNITIKSETITQTGIFSLLNSENLTELMKYEPEKADKVFFPNILSIEILINFFTHLLRNNSRTAISFYEPFRILLSLDLNGGLPNVRFLEMAERYSFTKKPDLAAITINPFYPEQVDYHFKASFIDKDLLKKTMREAIETPVYNVIEDGVDDLMRNIIKDNARFKASF